MNIYKERIRPLFDQSGLLDKELEREIGIRPKTISNWNTERVKSYDKYIAKIASYFGVSIDYLLGKTDNPNPTDAKGRPAPLRNERVAELLDLWAKLSPEEQDREMAFLRERVAASSKHPAPLK